MIPFDALPIDENGIMQGVWLLLHVDPRFVGYCGGVEMRDGKSLAPVSGRQLAHIAAECGHMLFMEPWPGPLPRDYVVIDGVSRVAPPHLLARLAPCPWRAPAPAVVPASAPPEATPPEAPAAPESGAGVDLDAVEAMGRGELLALAEARCIRVDRRWGLDRLRDEVLDGLTS
jgi:hypothetical protein